jgi:hypothetical protein
VVDPLHGQVRVQQVPRRVLISMVCGCSLKHRPRPETPAPTCGRRIPAGRVFRAI